MMAEETNHFFASQLVGQLFWDILVPKNRLMQSQIIPNAESIKVHAHFFVTWTAYINLSFYMDLPNLYDIKEGGAASPVISGLTPSRQYHSLHGVL